MRSLISLVQERVTSGSTNGLYGRLDDVGEILKFIATYMDFLWRGARFQIGDSEVSTVNGGNAYLVVESQIVRMRFVVDRSQLLLEFQRRTEGQLKTWYDVDLVYRLIEGNRDGSGLLDEHYARFVGANLDSIEQRFAADEWPDTEAKLRELGTIRAREHFG